MGNRTPHYTVDLFWTDWGYCSYNIVVTVAITHTLMCAVFSFCFYSHLSDLITNLPVAVHNS